MKQGLGMVIEERLDISQQCVLVAQNPTCPGLHHNKYEQQIKGGDSSPVLCSGDTHLEH